MSHRKKGSSQNDTFCKREFLFLTNAWKTDSWTALPSQRWIWIEWLHPKLCFHPKDNLRNVWTPIFWQLLCAPSLTNANFMRVHLLIDRHRLKEKPSAMTFTRFPGTIAWTTFCSNVDQWHFDKEARNWFVVSLAFTRKMKTSTMLTSSKIEWLWHCYQENFCHKFNHQTSLSVPSATPESKATVSFWKIVHTVSAFTVATVSTMFSQFYLLVTLSVASATLSQDDLCTGQLQLFLIHTES